MKSQLLIECVAHSACVPLIYYSQLFTRLSTYGLEWVLHFINALEIISFAPPFAALGYEKIDIIPSY